MIEHIGNPSLMLKEMCRVSRRKVAVRCLINGGAKLATPPQDYFDENWLTQRKEIQAFISIEFTTALDNPISNTIKKHTHWRIKLKD